MIWLKVHVRIGFVTQTAFAPAESSRPSLYIHSSPAAMQIQLPLPTLAGRTTSPADTRATFEPRHAVSTLPESIRPVSGRRHRRPVDLLDELHRRNCRECFRDGGPAKHRTCRHGDLPLTLFKSIAPEVCHFAVANHSDSAAHGPMAVHLLGDRLIYDLLFAGDQTGLSGDICDVEDFDADDHRKNQQLALKHHHAPTCGIVGVAPRRLGGVQQFTQRRSAEAHHDGA